MTIDFGIGWTKVWVRVRDAVGLTVLLFAATACEGSFVEPGSSGGAPSGGAPSSGGSGSGAASSGSPGSGGMTAACAVGQLSCGGTCVDTASSAAHCGACGNACPAGNVCEAGQCRTLCADGQLVCAGQCTTVQSSTQHCGACGNACPAGQLCNAGTCAADCSFQVCQAPAGGDVCADIATNPEHCGGCGAACLPSQSCIQGVCTLLCPQDRVACGSECVDTRTSAAHCGACNMPCAAGTPCINGFCGCPTGQTLCNGACVDAESDGTNCGACGNVCGTGQVCNQGQCATNCPDGQTVCGGGCTDTQTSATHCGACNQPCPAAQACTGGSCACPDGGSLCGTQCVSTGDSELHCGRCDNPCATGQTCTGGACMCAANQTLCNGACVDTRTNNNNCGSCGAVCENGQSCVAGACACPNDLTSCGGLCVDTDESEAHCGACNAACSVGQACLTGSCTGSSGVGQDGCTGGLARNLTVTQLAAYQTVKIPIMQDGQEVAAAARFTDVVEGRETLLRVFVSLGSGSTGRELSARVTLVNGTATDEYFSKKTISQTSTEADTNNTFQITLPPDKITASTRYAVEIVECTANVAGSAAAPRFPTTGNTALGARRTGPLKVRIIPILANSRLPDTSEAGLAPYRALLAAMYPVTGVEFTVGAQVSTAYPINWNTTLDLVRARRQTDAPPADVYYYGLLKPTDTFRQFCGNGCTAGIGFVPGTNDASRRVSIGIGFPEAASPNTMAHEVGHNHGRNHAPCVPAGGSISGVDSAYRYPGGNIGVWGYDQRTKALINPAGVTDIMGYCNNKWISDYTYDGLVNRVATVNGAANVYVDPAALAEWRILLLDESGPRWGISIDELAPPSGTPEIAEVYDATGALAEHVVVYRTEIPDIGAASIQTPKPKPGWYALRVNGSVPHPFAAP